MDQEEASGYAVSWADINHWTSLVGCLVMLGLNVWLHRAWSRSTTQWIKSVEEWKKIAEEARAAAKRNAEIANQNFEHAEDGYRAAIFWQMSFRKALIGQALGRLPPE